jgi:hypothetical protein
MKPSLLDIFENIQYLCKKKIKKETKRNLQCIGKYFVVTGIKKMQLIRRDFEPEPPRPSVRCSTN